MARQKERRTGNDAACKKGDGKNGEGGEIEGEGRHLDKRTKLDNAAQGGLKGEPLESGKSQKRTDSGVRVGSLALHYGSNAVGRDNCGIALTEAQQKKVSRLQLEIDVTPVPLIVRMTVAGDALFSGNNRTRTRSLTQTKQTHARRECLTDLQEGQYLL